MLCEEHGIIFVHIPKTGGQSIETFFLNKLGLGWTDRARLLLRANDDPTQGPDRLAHLTASEYVSCGHVSRARFEEFFKFTFVRNPFDRLVSEYFYRKHHLRFTFRDFVLHHLPAPSNSDPYRHVMPQSKFVYGEKGALLVDFVGKTENIDSDFRAVCNRIGVEYAPLPRVNRSSRTGSAREYLKYWLGHRKEKVRKKYRDYYDSRTRAIVQNLYQCDLEIFDYRF